MQSSIFIAGGIGITPFRSMIQDALDKKKKLQITLFYQSDKDEVLFRDVFDKAEKEIGLKVVYITDGKFHEALLRKHTPNFLASTFYISGPQGMVEEYRTIVESLGVPFEEIKTDLFTGYVSG